MAYPHWQSIKAILENSYSARPGELLVVVSVSNARDLRKIEQVARALLPFGEREPRCVLDEATMTVSIFKGEANAPQA
jgi:hypothetical protein